MRNVKLVKTVDNILSKDYFPEEGLPMRDFLNDLYDKVGTYLQLVTDKEEIADLNWLFDKVERLRKKYY